MFGTLLEFVVESLNRDPCLKKDYIPVIKGIEAYYRETAKQRDPCVSLGDAFNVFNTD